jgi:small-conductance mechanosensitive channel
MMHQDLVAVGDEVKLYDGTDGYIHRLGWVSSTIRGLDDIYIQIPNSHLLHKPLTNISRAKRCQVKQILRFKYSDLDHIPTILEEIQSRVKETCPKLITKGTPYRAVICSYETDHVQAMVNFHFEIPSQTEAFYRNRQEVLVVIGSVMKEHGVEFALPVMETTQN